MPPKPKFTREELVDAALDIVCEKGVEALTARELGAKLASSARPIFTVFSGMDEVKDAVREKAAELYRSYIRRGAEAPIPSQGVGIAYVRFARENPNLYKMLYLTAAQDGHLGTREILRESQELVRKPIMDFFGMTDKEADQYFTDMWLVGHAFASLCLAEADTFTDEEILTVFRQISGSLVLTQKTHPEFLTNPQKTEEIFRKMFTQGDK